MDWALFTKRLVAEHHSDPQTVRKIELATAQAQSALSNLASMGHQFHLAPGPGESLPLWPRTLFHATDAPNGRVIYNQLEANALGPGWADDLAQAQHEHGVALQFAGRGGVGRLALPTAQFAPQSESERIAERTKIREEAKAALLARKGTTKW